MNTPNHPPRVNCTPTGAYPVGEENEHYFSFLSDDPDYFIEYLSLSEHESLLSKAQARIRELEEALETIVHTSRVEGCGYVDDRATPRYFSPMSPQTIAAKALAAKGTK